MTATTLALPGQSAQARASTYSARRRKLAVLVVALAFVMDRRSGPLPVAEACLVALARLLRSRSR